MASRLCIFLLCVAYNLSYDTLVVRQDEDKVLPNERTTLTPIQRRFVQSDVRKGVIPQVLEWLIAARKQVRAAQKETTDPFIKAVLDERQKAIKVRSVA